MDSMKSMRQSSDDSTGTRETEKLVAVVEKTGNKMVQDNIARQESSVLHFSTADIYSDF